MEILFLKSVGIGIAVAAPVGPIGALCIRKSLVSGRISAIITGLGAATADAFYGAVAAFGLTAISDLLISYHKPAAAIGGLFLIYMSVQILRSSRRVVAPEILKNDEAAWPGFLSTFFLTLTNPATILSFAAIFAGIGFLQNIEDRGSAITVVVGVFTGSAIWWVFLAFLSHELKKRLGIRFETLVSLVSGLLIGLFGAGALLSSFF